MKWIFTSITVWLVFVLSLSAWWMIFGIQTLSQIATLDVEAGSTILRQQKMLFYEGSVLALMQILGAVFLFYFSYRMYKEKSAAENFFASFTHDLKTSLFRLQLQIEGMEATHPSPGTAKALAKARRLQLNLENGLDSVLGQKKSLFIEKIQLADFVAELLSLIHI